MADTPERALTTAEIREKIAAAKRAKDAGRSHGPDERRADELEEHNSRVNPAALHGGVEAREPYTLRARRSQIRAIKKLAKDLSRPRQKVSVAALMDEAIELLLAKYHRGSS